MAEALTREQRNWRMRIFIVTWLAYAGFYLCRKNLSVIAPQLKEMGLTDFQYANIIFGYSLLYAIGQFFNGVFSDRFGPRLIVGIGLFLTVFSSIYMGFIGSVFSLLLILNCLNGIGQSTGWSGLVKNMATWFRQEERGVVMAWWGTNYVLGGFIATGVATYFAYDLPFFSSWGWRRGFWFPAVLLSVILLIFTLFTRNKPSDAGLPDFPEDDEHIQPPAATNAAEMTSQNQVSWDIILAVLAKPTVWIIAVMYFFLKLTRYAFLFWLPIYMTERLGYSDQAAGYTSSVYELIGFTGAVSAGYISDKLFGSRRFPVGAIFLFGLGLAFFFHPILAGFGNLGNAIGISLIGFLTYGPDTLMTGAGAQDDGSQRGAATAAGFINGVGSTGQLLSGYIVAYVKDAFGWDSIFHLFVIFAFVGAALLAVKWNYLPNRLAEK